MNIFSEFIINLYFRFAGFRRIIWSMMAFSSAAVILVVLFSGSDVTTNPVGWEKTFMLSRPGIVAKKIKSVSNGNFIAAVYEGTEGKTNSVWLSISFNSGKSFVPAIKIADIPADIDANPHVAVSARGKIAVAWQSLADADTRIFYSVSSDFGKSWTPLSQVQIGYEMELLPAIYFDNRESLHLFFHAYRDGIFNLYHAVSRDLKIFNVTDSITRMKDRMRGAFFPSVCLKENFVFVAWQTKGENFQDDIYFVRSSNYGSSWSSVERITSAKGSSSSPEIIFFDDVIYLVFQNNAEKNWGIKLMRGFNRGELWDKEPVSVSSTNANSYAPNIIALTGELLFLWYDTREKNSAIYARKYSVNDEKFLPEVKLSSGINSARNPFGISSGGKSVVFWEELGRINARYSDIHVEVPSVFSATHPDGVWSREPVARISWAPPQDESGIAGYATITNRIADFNPTVQNFGPNINRIAIQDLEDGVTYFHIRAIDGAGNYSRTVHYRLNVSARPLPMPVVVSPLHPQGKSSDVPDAVMRWAIQDTERLKGFVYSFSKDKFTRPDKFITDFEIKFDDLKEGHYFFSIAAVDKTNALSQVAAYNFSIGKAELVDPEYIKKIAAGQLDLEEKIKKKEKPVVEINFPFDIKSAAASQEFSAVIIPRNISPERVKGYSVVIDRERTSPPDKINLKGNILNVSALKEGGYVIGIKGKYISENGSELWTDAAFISFRVEIPEDLSPLQRIQAVMIRDFSGRHLAGTVSIAALLSLVVFFGYGGRIFFSFRNFTFRFRNIMLLLFK